MGMPISSYTVLNALSSDSERGGTQSYATLSHEIHETAAAALEPFNLFAFIIHDPQTHPEFHERISHIFSALDVTTGNKFLFFALVDPPEEWSSNAARRNYYKHLRSWQPRILLDPHNAITSADTSTAALALAKSLNISIDNLPCLVVTRDFRLENVHWVKTCPDHVAAQLTLLGSYATTYEDPPLYPLTRQIDLCGGSGIELLGNVSMAKALADVMSFAILNNNRVPNSQREQALEQARKTLLELRSDLILLKKAFRASKTEELDDLDDLCETIGSFLGLANPRDHLNLADFIDIDERYLEPESRIMLKTAHRVVNLLKDPLPGFYRLVGGVDYTPGLICLAKAFEREINLSYVHKMREELSVLLPDYFDKYQEGRTARYSSVDFNIRKGDTDKWLPPGILQSLRAYEAKFSVNESHPEKPLLNRWKQIGGLRNKAAHTELMDYRSVQDVQANLNKLSDAGFFAEMDSHKRYYRNPH